MIPMTLEITMSRPDGTPVTLYRTPSGRTVGPTPVGDVTVDWGRASPRDHADPSTVTLVIDQPAGQDVPFDFDSELTITATTVGPPQLEIALSRCYVQSWHRDHLEHFDRYTIQAVDLIGRTQAWMLSAPPWPSESANTRLGRIRTLAPGAVSPTFGFSGSTVGARDVDNMSVFELVTRTANPHWIVHPTLDGLTQSFIGGLLSYNSNDDKLEMIELAAHLPAQLSTAAVGDFGADLSRASRLNRVQVEQPEASDANSTETVTFQGRSDLVGPTATHKVATDRLDAADDYADMFRGIMAGVDMLYNGTERDDVLFPAPTRLVLHAAPIPGAPLGLALVAALTDLETRLVTPVQLFGPLRRPDLPTVLFVTAGRAVVNGRDGLARLELTFQPGDVAGIRHMRHRDWRRYYPAPSAPTYTFNQLRTTFTSTRTQYHDTSVVRLRG